jgi:hypothetical protein
MSATGVIIPEATRVVYMYITDEEISKNDDDDEVDEPKKSQVVVTVD